MSQNDEAVYLAERAFLFDGPVGMTPPTDDQIDDFDPDNPDAFETLIPGLLHIGHTDLDQDLEGDEEGGKSEVRGTRQTPNLRVRDEPVTDFFTATIVQWTEHNQWLYWGGGAVVGGRFVAPTSAKSVNRLVLVIFVDGDRKLGRLHRKCAVKRGGPVSMASDNFMGAPVRFTPLNPSDAGIGAVEWINNSLFLAGPEAPAGLVAGAATASTVALTWSAVAGVSGYVVQRRPAAGGSWTDVASNAGGAPTSASTSVTGLTAATAYQFRVLSVASGTRGSGSVPVTKSTAAS